jgi:hypothetical protein
MQANQAEFNYNDEPSRPSLNSRGNTDYKERSPLDLIEEDKRPYAIRKLLSTFLGGARIVYNETSQKYIHPLLYFTQLFNYLQFPIVCLLLFLFV